MKKEENSKSLNPKTAEQIKLLARPSNSLELLRNIKLALENHWLLDRDFFTPYNLCRLLGTDAQDIQILEEDGDTTFYILISSTGHTVPLSELYKEASYPVAATFQGGFRIVRGMSVGSISLSYEIPDFTFGEVEKVFGKNWVRIEMPAPLHSIPSPPTSPLGNLTVKYDFIGSGLDESILLKTNSVGSVSNIRFKDGDK